MGTSEVANLITEVAAEFEIQRSILDRLVKIESSYNPAAKGSSGELGLLQVMPITFDDYVQITGNPNGYQFTDLENPKTGLQIGAWYWAERIPGMLKHFGLPDTIANRVASWNWGIGNLIKVQTGEKSIPSQVKRYIERVEDAAQTAAKKIVGASGCAFMATYMMAIATTIVRLVV